jgi:hypothetical protein
MSGGPLVRNSDRLATPAVVITMLAIGGILVGLTIVGVTYLTARHIDPEPVFKLVGIAVTGLSSLGAPGRAMRTPCCARRPRRRQGDESTRPRADSQPGGLGRGRRCPGHEPWPGQSRRLRHDTPVTR